mmetsp:Transcript_15791/g.44277  ORF Transcript_15791/g.44277 Transcript_15791/m.44277 type:complete len:406 (-) Transcript_15791:91-1308(-)
MKHFCYYLNGGQRPLSILFDDDENPTVGDIKTAIIGREKLTCEASDPQLQIYPPEGKSAQLGDDEQLVDIMKKYADKDRDPVFRVRAPGQWQNFYGPQGSPMLASAMNSMTLDEIQEYNDNTILEDIQYGAFINVPSYFEFVKGAKDLNEPFSSAGTNIISTYQKRSYPKVSETDEPYEEFVRAQLSEFLSVEFAGYNATFVHQQPIIPKHKNGLQKVDVAMKVKDNTRRGYRPTFAMMITCKAAGDFDSFIREACCYGVDAQSIANQPMIVVQTVGTDLATLKIRALGIVPCNEDLSPVVDNDWIPHLCKSLLMEDCSGAGLHKLVNGVKAYIPAFKSTYDKDNEAAKRKWVGVQLSRDVVVAPDGEYIRKVYDYRDDHHKQGQKRNSAHQSGGGRVQKKTRRN